MFPSNPLQAGSEGSLKLARSPLTNWPGSHHPRHGNMGNAAWSKPPKPKPEKGGNALEGEGGE